MFVSDCNIAVKFASCNEVGVLISSNEFKASGRVIPALCTHAQLSLSVIPAAKPSFGNKLSRVKDTDACQASMILVGIIRGRIGVRIGSRKIRVMSSIVRKSDRRHGSQTRSV